MRIMDIMSRDVKTVAPTGKAETAYATLEKYGIHHLVVVADGKVLGIVSHRDLGGARGASIRKNRTVSDLMTPKPLTVRPEDTLRQAANKLRGRGIGCLPVVDEGKVKGIVTISDCLDLLGRGVEKPIGKSERRLLSKKRGRESH